MEGTLLGSTFFYIQFKSIGELYNEPVHDNTYYKTCATSEDLDQPAYSRNLIRVFADHMYLLQPPGYPKRERITRSILGSCTD